MLQESSQLSKMLIISPRIDNRIMFLITLFTEYTHTNYANFISSVFPLQIETFQCPFYSTEGSRSLLPLRETQQSERDLACTRTANVI